MVHEDLKEKLLIHINENVRTSSSTFCSGLLYSRQTISLSGKTVISVLPCMEGMEQEPPRYLSALSVFVLNKRPTHVPSLGNHLINDEDACATFSYKHTVICLH